MFKHDKYQEAKVVREALFDIERVARGSSPRIAAAFDRALAALPKVEP